MLRLVIVVIVISGIDVIVVITVRRFFLTVYNDIIQIPFTMLIV